MRTSRKNRVLGVRKGVKVAEACRLQLQGEQGQPTLHPAWPALSLCYSRNQ